jgi:predicted esterase
VSYFLEVERKIRIETLGNSNSDNLLVVLHGYGQLAKYFLKKFSPLEQENYYIVAPEGPHRFYLNGSNGRVGASWMTKELRELDIEENNQLLEKILTNLTELHNFKSISVLGFSQGAATVARWASTSLFEIDKLIIWASVFPPDINLDFLINSFASRENYFVIGNKDIYFDEIKKQKTIEFYKFLNFKVVLFEGGHDIETNSLFLCLK